MQSSNASATSSLPSNDDSEEDGELLDQELDQEVRIEIGIDQGELKVLQADLEGDGTTIDTKEEKSFTESILTSLDVQSSYGKPLSPEEAAKAVPPGDEGLVRYALVVPDNFCNNGKLVSGLNNKDFDIENGLIKPRRPSLPITMSELMTSLTKLVGEDGQVRYIFSGVLNGWPSLRQFELIEIDKKRSLGPLHPPDYFHTLRHTWSRYWRADKEGKDGISPAIRDRNRVYRAKLRGAPWTSLGWSPESPGFLFWYEAQRESGARVVYGTDAVNEVGNDICTMVHMISHRYATARETPKDKLTYHSIVLLEWEHGKYTTIVEGAFLNGIGGYKGRSNWYEDKDDGITELYKALPPEMISPWLTTAAELRCFDVKAKNLEEMKIFINQYVGPGGRFIDPRYTFSHPARLSYRSKANIAHYLLNYIGRDCGYSELTRNCQTFAADLCSFLAGKKEVVPFHPVNRMEYHNRTHLFLYDSSMFAKRKGETLKGRIVK